MTDIIQFLAIFTAGGISTAAAIVFVLVWIIKHPDLVDIWYAKLLKMLARAGAMFGWAHKEYVRRDFQGRVNRWVAGISSDIPRLQGARAHIEWVNGDEPREVFLKNDKVVIRLQRNDPEERNFARAAHWYISHILLFNVKSYLSKTQRKSIDTFVVSKLLEAERDGIKDAFLAEFVRPEYARRGSDVPALLETFARIDRSGLFFPVLLQELNHIGLRVFGRAQIRDVIDETRRLIEHLNCYASRNVGDDTGNPYIGEYCSYALVLVGRGRRIAEEGIDPYRTFMRRAILPKKIESLYVIGDIERRGLIDDACRCLEDSYERVRSVKYTNTIAKKSGEVCDVETYLVLMRRRGAAVMYPRGRSLPVALPPNSEFEETPDASNR